MTQVSIDQALELALQHHQAGHLSQAEQIYRHILAAEPRHGDALNLLGALAGQAGQHHLAIDFINRAVAAAPSNPSYHFHLGTHLQALGQLDAAIAAYQRAVTLRGDYPEAHNNLANALKANGRLDEAIAAYHEALALRPEFVEAHNNLGLAWSDRGSPSQAIVCFQRALSLDPGYVDAHINLGAAWFAKGELDKAIECCEQALSLQPDSAEALANLATALRDKGQLDRAIEGYERALSIKPGFVEAQNHLGVAWKQKGNLDRAIDCFQRAIAINPSFAAAHTNLGIVLNQRSRHGDAIACFQRALDIDPQLVGAHVGMGIALKDNEELDGAIACFERALACDSSVAAVHHELGNACRASGQLDQAIVCFQRALAIEPNNVIAHDDLILTRLYHAGSDAGRQFAECRDWNRRHAEPLKKFIEPHTNTRDPDRTIRIGYASADFMQHPCAAALLPLFRHHDRRQFDLFCYAEVPRPDQCTRQIQDLIPQWRQTLGRSDADVASMIREDQIDILVDLKLHTPFNRLLVFARKPAPVQVTWLGYPGSTGLDTIDYRLTDPHLDPPDGDPAPSSESLIPLPNSFWCFDPLAETFDETSLPAEQNGFITFGSLNSFCKINNDVLTLWARVMKDIPDSRLILLAPPGNSHRRVLEVMHDHGIGSERIEMIKRQLRGDYLQTFRRIDIHLDSFPYNGHVTSLDALWMGVPVVTLVGQTIVGRAGLSLLTNVGLPELIARTPDQFVKIATTLATDVPRLSELRSTLRRRMQASPLMDAAGFARDIESAYRQIWRTWCRS